MRESLNQLQPRELAARIEGEVRALGLQPGDRVPTEAALATALGITRHRVRKGISWLKAHKGWVQIQGSGTYLPGGAEPRRPKEKTVAVIGPSVLQMASEFDEVQMRAMGRGYHILNMNVSHVHIRHEWACLESALARRVAAVCLEPLPTDPWDHSRIDALHEEDIKVALMSAPHAFRDKYSLFTLDFAAAGEMGARELLRAGARRVICCDKQYSGTPPWHYTDWAGAARVFASARGVEFRHCHMSAFYNQLRLEMQWTEGAEPVPVDPEAGYLCLQISQAALVRRELRAAGLENPRLFTISVNRIESPFPYALLDNRTRLRRMFRYAMDGTISPRRRLTDIVPPELVPPSTDW